MIKPLPKEQIGFHENIIATRSFHFGNLVLRLIHDHNLDMFRIQAFRINDSSSHDLWGIWFVGDGEDRAEIQLEATRKFNSIAL